jgi:hypothetical protein
MGKPADLKFREMMEEVRIRAFGASRKLFKWPCPSCGKLYYNSIQKLKDSDISFYRKPM